MPWTVSDFSVNIDEPFINFQNHIEIDGNNRILFSGKFGSGKTFFLTQYFKKHSDKYSPFWLVPVDYSVSNNEDIFEYIKVDISKQLIPLLPKEPQEKFSKILYLQQFIIHSHFKIISSILSNVKLKIKPIEKTEIEISLKDILEKLPKEYNEFKKAIQKKGEDKLTKNIEDQLEKKGSIYEDDIVTQTIRASIEFLKNQDKKKESVLIIDDLDRLDPEHIFRILNVLSAHNNHWGEDNKFGFDKIIIVCDVANIQKIFEHKYGKEVDFDGYIDKFYAHSIYHFSNEDGIKLFCSSIFNNDLNESELFLLSKIMVKFYEEKHITIRKLRKIVFTNKIKNINIEEDFIVPESNWFNQYSQQVIIEDLLVKFSVSDFKILKVIQLLNCMIGDFKKLINILKSLEGSIILKQPDVIKVYDCLGLLHHFSLNIKKRELYYSYILDSKGNKVGCNFPLYNHYFIKLPWFYNNNSKEHYQAYKSSESYFKNASFIKSEDYKSSSPNEINLYKILYEITDFISKDKRFATAIGITS
ncbi:P-loop NTPase fold protein [Emticicia sp. C21]|uniref:P-loop NTPase fold protein n=1 Tax=Emticicia sp. C21 TaxID=2302915 RepID=UPI001314A8C3|nr:P-loop NTPase fold protein [Emticicia sp. C21]